MFTACLSTSGTGGWGAFCPKGETCVAAYGLAKFHVPGMISFGKRGGADPPRSFSHQAEEAGGRRPLGFLFPFPRLPSKHAASFRYLPPPPAAAKPLLFTYARASFIVYCVRPCRISSRASVTGFHTFEVEMIFAFGFVPGRLDSLVNPAAERGRFFEAVTGGGASDRGALRPHAPVLVEGPTLLSSLGAALSYARCARILARMSLLSTCFLQLAAFGTPVAPTAGVRAVSLLALPC